MTIKSFALLLIIPFTTFSKNTDTTKTKKISIGLTCSPNYCYRMLKPDGSRTNEAIVAQRNSIEIAKLGLTTGINVAFQLSKSVAMEAAVLYSNKGEKTKEFVFSTNDPDAVQKATFIFSFSYIDVPIKVNYYLYVQKLKFYLTAGMSANFFLTAKVISHETYNDGHTQTNKVTLSHLDSYPAVNLAALAGFGFSYALTPNIYVMVEPIYRGSLTSMVHSQIKEYLYSVALNTGIYYKL